MVAPPPPPQAVEAYKKKGQDHSAVVRMVTLLIADLDKEVTNLGVDERDAQAEYEQYIKDAGNKRMQDNRSIAMKQDQRANTEAHLLKLEPERKDVAHQSMATAETLKDLHLDCDWLIANAAERKE